MSGRATGRSSWSTLLLILVLGLPIWIFAIGNCSRFHHRYIHPLGRLANSVHVGDDCRALRASFDAYAQGRRRDRVELEEFLTHGSLTGAREVPESRGLRLQDRSLFGDVELAVLCNAEGKVFEIFFLGG